MEGAIRRRNESLNANGFELRLRLHGCVEILFADNDFDTADSVEFALLPTPSWVGCVGYSRSQGWNFPCRPV